MASFITELKAYAAAHGWSDPAATFVGPDSHLEYTLQSPSYPESTYRLHILLRGEVFALAFLDTRVDSIPWSGLSPWLSPLYFDYRNLLAERSIFGRFGFILRTETSSFNDVTEFAAAAVICADRLHQALTRAQTAVRLFAEELIKADDLRSKT